MAKLRAKKPEAVEKRLKALFYGQAGVGKTTAAIQFPKPYLIDTERGAENEQYVELLEKNGGVIFQTTDFDELLEEVKALLTTEHDYKTIIIDPLTTMYSDLCEKWANKLAKQSKDPNSDGTEFQRHRDKADMQIKHLYKLLLRLDMNVIITSHLKVKWEKVGGELKEVGNTFDCYKKMDYLFDLVFEIQKRGKERVGIVKKTRIKGFIEGEQFTFNYDTMAEKYGRAILERDAKTEVLATTEQVSELNRLIALLKVSDEDTQKWLDKANAETFDEMQTEQIDKCIKFLESKIQGEK
jgi:DNA polymerase III delta prime subunit